MSRDPEKNRAWRRAWYEANREKLKAKARVNHYANRDRNNARRRSHYQEHREQRRVSDRAYYQANRDRALAYYRNRTGPNRERASALKMARGCEAVLPDGSVHGWREHPSALEFDHRDPAEKLFTIAMRMDLPWEVLLSEIAKCDVLCSNCHRVRTAAEGHQRLRNPRVIRDDPQLSLFEDSAEEQAS